LRTLRINPDAEKSRRGFSENDLDGHLSNPEGEESGDTTAADTDQEEEDLAESDFQLFEALNLLKGLRIMNQINKG